MAAFDFGFGGGNHLWMLAREGFNVWGIDITDEVKNFALRTLINFGESIPNEQLLVGGIDAFASAPSNFFDVIVDRQSLTQLNHSTAIQYVAEFRRILKPEVFILACCSLIATPLYPLAPTHQTDSSHLSNQVLSQVWVNVSS